MVFWLMPNGLPTSVGVHHKKSSSVSDESFVIDFNNNDNCTSGCSSSFYAVADPGLKISQLIL